MKVQSDTQFKPFVSADKVMPEFTVYSIIAGIVLAALFCGANAYLGLRVGMTVSASIPAAVISMGFVKGVFHKDSILESNMVQTIASAGESLAAGAIFIMPALFLWAKEWNESAPSLLLIGLIALIGGIIGVLFMIPLRGALIVQEHGTLPYPEGTACAEVLLAGESGGAKSSTVFKGMGVAALYKFIADGIKLFPNEVHYEMGGYKGAGIGMDVLPALAGVGYICGPKISAYMLSGGILGWLVLMPLISLFGGDMTLFPGAVPISSMDSWTIWGKYIKYIGAGAVAMGGMISLAKSLPLIINTFKKSLASYGKNKGGLLRTETDISSKVIIIALLVMAVFVCLYPSMQVNVLGIILIIVFGFFFATVSSRMVGIVGCSNNPVSGMTIATLLIVSIILKTTMGSNHESMTTAIIIGSFCCVIAAVAGNTSQVMKPGYILGATPKKQQIGVILGVVASAITISVVLFLLDKAWGFGGKEIPAPQASLMKMVVEGVIGGNLPWNLIFAGAGIAVVIEILGIPSLPVAIGLYLPIHLSTPIMVGGLVRLYYDKRKMAEEKRNGVVQDGVLYSAGLIAGEGLVGILLAVFAIIPVGEKNFANVIDISEKFSIGQIGALVCFAVLILILMKSTLWKKQSKKA